MAHALAALLVTEIFEWPVGARAASFAAGMEICFDMWDGTVCGSGIFTKGVDCPPFSVTRAEWEEARKQSAGAVFDPSVAERIAASGQLIQRCKLDVDTPAQTPSPESWARILEALDRCHPGWIDGNGSAVEKVVKFIEGTR